MAETMTCPKCKATEVETETLVGRRYTVVRTKPHVKPHSPAAVVCVAPISRYSNETSG